MVQIERLSIFFYYFCKLYLNSNAFGLRKVNFGVRIVWFYWIYFAFLTAFVVVFSASWLERKGVNVWSPID